MSLCPNCGATLSCGCQRRTLPDGSQGCSSCITKAKVVAAPKQAGQAVVSNSWSTRRKQTLNKFIN